MQKIKGFWQQVRGIPPVYWAAILFAFLGIVLGLSGYLNQHCFSSFCARFPNPGESFNNFVRDFYSNISMTFIGTAITVLVIDRLNEKRAAQLLKAQLIREAGSPHNSVAVRALEELDAHGWLQDGSLQGAKLWDANWEGAKLENADLRSIDLHNANLSKAFLVKCNLEGADLLLANTTNTTIVRSNLSNVDSLFPSDFIKMNQLHRTIMPDGKLYDGRYNLSRDLSMAKLDNIDVEDFDAMARFYGVKHEQYAAGQQWRQDIIAQFSKEHPIIQRFWYL